MFQKHLFIFSPNTSSVTSTLKGPYFRNSTFQCELKQLAPTVKLNELFWEYIVLDVQVLLILWKENVR